MRIACTGYLSEQTGSIAGANALLLRSLLERGMEVDFFSKPSFVDPRPIAAGLPGLRFVPCVNSFWGALRRKVRGVPVLDFFGGRMDAASYNQLLVQQIRKEHRRRSYDLCLWMGDYSRGAIPGIPTVSFVQGPPGTDARSVLERSQELKALCGHMLTLKWTTLARLRLSPLGLPGFRHSDYFIVGSEQSRATLRRLYGINPALVSIIPYPVDLKLFYPVADGSGSGDGPLRVLWAGRIVPRKRLDLFLEGAARAIEQGVDVRLTIVGPVGFVVGYERLIKEFQYPERLEWIRGVARREMPAIMRRHDVLAQPSDEENFGSSVAEAQACGLPVIVGATNGNANYLCSRDIHLDDDRPETFARSLSEMWQRRRLNQGDDFLESRRVAEEHFQVDRVVERLSGVLDSVLARSRGGHEKVFQKSTSSL
jgi:glycosyltransferase involved in cell wall biosynthesis